MRETVNDGVVAITGMGMVTSLGTDVSNCCAAARAGIVKTRELRIVNPDSSEFWGGEFPVGYTAPSIPEGFLGYARVLLLARDALSDLLARAPLSEAGRTGIYIALSDQFYQDSSALDEREEMHRIMEAYTAEG